MLWNFIYKYIVLARLTKPLPIFLLIFPAFWGITLSSKENFNENIFDVMYTYTAFLLGGILARSFGAVINDIADRKIDKLVSRTKSRMIASNQISLIGAIIYSILLGIGAVAILITFNNSTIIMGIICAILTIIYPFTKRITFFPQVFLGLTYSMGVLMGEVALNNYLTLPNFLLYVACICWVIGFDSIYAIQDYEDDRKVGVKSIVVYFGSNIQSVVAYLYLTTLMLLVIVGYLLKFSFGYYCIIVLVALHFIWQIININIWRPQIAGLMFNYNVYVGLLIWIAFLIG